MKKEKINSLNTIKMAIKNRLPELKKNYEWIIFDLDVRSFDSNLWELNISLFEIRKKQKPLIKEWIITSINSELPRLEDIPERALKNAK